MGPRSTPSSVEVTANVVTDHRYGAGPGGHIGVPSAQRISKLSIKEKFKTAQPFLVLTT